ncbi:MAG: tetratricopeptide repeat protein [Acidobacteriia bacterium]|nr:tetratricopeptide repeat protein [Terriglobia bacterium]
MRIVLAALLITLSAMAGDPTAEALMENGHWKRARAIVEAAYKAHPNEAQANYSMARVRHEFGNLDDAAKFSEAAVRLDPKSSPAHRELGEIYADQTAHVSFLKQLGLGHKIKSEFDAALSIAPKDPANIFDQIQYYMEAPGVAGGDKKKALETANDLVKINPARGYLALAYIARQQKEEDKLERLYQKAVESDARNYAAQINLAALYISPQHAQPGRAIEHAQAALDLNSDRIESYRVLAAALALAKKFDDDARLLGRAETAIPDDLSPYVFSARALLRDGVELQKAEGYLKKYFNETNEPEPGAPLIAGAHWSLGLVYEKEGRKPEARAELETALRLKPDFEPAKKDLKRLK